MQLFLYGNCQMRAISRIVEYLTEPYNTTCIFINDIDKLNATNLPLIELLLEDSDLFISTYVPDYLSEDFQTPRHLLRARKAVVIPNIYFFGAKPSIGELTYPNGSRGYEDIWLYFTVHKHLIASSTLGPGFFERLIAFCQSHIYKLDGEPEEEFTLFAKECIRASISQLKARENSIDQLAKQHQNTVALHISDLIVSNLSKLADLFFTTDHPSPELLLEIAVAILDNADIHYCKNRLELLREYSFSQIDLSSVDFIKFGCPVAYLLALGILPTDNIRFIEYKQRYKIGRRNEVAMSDYLYQLHSRIKSSSSTVIDSNQRKLAKYNEMQRLYDFTEHPNWDV